MQSALLQVRVFKLSPEQIEPSFGLLHSRLLMLCSPEHVSGHEDHELQSLHPPTIQIILVHIVI